MNPRTEHRKGVVRVVIVATALVILLSVILVCSTKGDENMTNCPNCGAVVDLHAEACAYCGTPYPRNDEPALSSRIELTADGITLTLHNCALAQAVNLDLMTSNEARRRMGLRGI